MTIPFEQCQSLFTCVHYAEDIEFLLIQTDSAEHEPVAAEGLQGVDTHAAHHFLYLVIPCVNKVHKALVRNIRIKALYKVGTLRCNTPVALTGVAASAQVAAHGEQSRSSYVDCVRAERDCLYDVRTASDGTAHNDGDVISDTLVAEPLVNARESQLYRNAYVIADPCRSRAGTSSVAVDGDYVRTASRNTGSDRRNIGEIASVPFGIIRVL